MHPRDPPERALRQQIKAVLEASGYLVIYLEEVQAFGRPGTRGLPDIVAIRKGKHLWIEVKTKRGTVKPMQQIMHDRLRAAGADVIIARSTDDVLAAIRRE